MVVTNCVENGDKIWNAGPNRSFAFWEFDSPDHPKTFIPVNLNDVKMVTRSYIRWGVTHRPGRDTFPEPPYLFESEPAYLKRKNLLKKGELKRINPDDFEPKDRYPLFEPCRFGKYSRIDDPETVCSESSHGLAKYDLVDIHYPARFKIHNE